MPDIAEETTITSPLLKPLHYRLTYNEAKCLDLRAKLSIKTVEKPLIRCGFVAAQIGPYDLPSVSFKVSRSRTSAKKCASVAGQHYHRETQLWTFALLPSLPAASVLAPRERDRRA